MKVYVIKAKKIAYDSLWYVYNVYSSHDKAIKVYKELQFLGDDHIYRIDEFSVID